MGVTGRDFVNLPVERVAEDTAGGAEESGAQGESSPSLFINNYIKIFIQDMACAVDYNGKLLLEEKGRFATSPNGNGGWFTSMVKAGLDKDLHLKNIKWINIFAVDNVLQRIADPAFIGATILGNYQSASKVVRKVEPMEKMGLLCLEDGKPSIVKTADCCRKEYSFHRRKRPAREPDRAKRLQVRTSCSRYDPHDGQQSRLRSCAGEGVCAD